MMIHFGKWCPKIMIPGLMNTYTEINIIEGYSKIFFIQPTDVFINFFTYYKTCSSNRYKILDKISSSKVAWVVTMYPQMRMTGNPLILI
jgi:hypothetical protein